MSAHSSHYRGLHGPGRALGFRHGKNGPGRAGPGRAGPDPERTIDKPNDIPKKTHIYLKIRIFRISTASSNPTPPTYCPILPI
jgi:hypothetical protein